MFVVHPVFIYLQRLLIHVHYEFWPEFCSLQVLTFDVEVRKWTLDAWREKERMRKTKYTFINVILICIKCPFASSINSTFYILEYFYSPHSTQTSNSMRNLLPSQITQITQEILTIQTNKRPILEFHNLRIGMKKGVEQAIK